MVWGKSGLVMLSTFAALVRGVMFYDYLFAGAGVGANVCLGSAPVR